MGDDGTYGISASSNNSGNEIEQRTDFEKFSPPTQFRVGAAVDPITFKEHFLTVSAQLNHPVDNAEYIVTGLEYSFMEIFFLRSGYKFNKNEENLTLGVGLFIPLGRFKLRVDYGYANFDHLTDPNRFSIGISL